MVGVLWKYNLQSMVFAELFQRLLQGIINILFEIFINCGILAVNACYQFIKQYQLIFGQGIYNFMRVFAAFKKVGDDYIMRIIIVFI